MPLTRKDRIKGMIALAKSSKVHPNVRKAMKKKLRSMGIKI